jgi:hypothetical protein
LVRAFCSGFKFAGDVFSESYIVEFNDSSVQGQVAASESSESYGRRGRGRGGPAGTQPARHGGILTVTPGPSRRRRAVQVTSSCLPVPVSKRAGGGPGPGRTVTVPLQQSASGECIYVTVPHQQSASGECIYMTNMTDITNMNPFAYCTFGHRH